jgi:hypothetical protein
MAVTDDGGRGRLSWSCRFEPDDGASKEEIVQLLRRSYDAMMDLIEEHLNKA